MRDELQKVRVDLWKTKSQLDREQRQKRTHIATLEEAQAKQLSDKDGQIADLQVSPLSTLHDTMQSNVTTLLPTHTNTDCVGTNVWRSNNRAGAGLVSQSLRTRSKQALHFFWGVVFLDVNLCANVK